MKKIFLLAIAGLLSTGSIAYAKGKHGTSKNCTNKHCTTQTCPDGCPKVCCKKG